MVGTPTVRPKSNFNADEDAAALKKAFKGFGSDEKVIIDIITHRSNEQRQQIAQRYKTMYGKDLIKEIKGELRGHFEDVIVALLTEPTEFLARELHRAISGLGTNEAVLVEILSTHDNKEIRKISQVYEEIYKTTLEKDIIGDTSGTVKKILVSLSTGNRDETEIVDQQKAFQEAQKLLRAGELAMGTEESVFRDILCQRNRSQLQQIFDEYEKITGHPFEKAIEKEFSFTSKESLLSLIHAIRNKGDYLVTRLHDSMARLGTDDHTLIRIVVSRSEIDLEDLKEMFQKKYGKTLANFVQDDTSGEYRKCLLAIIE